MSRGLPPPPGGFYPPLPPPPFAGGAPPFASRPPPPHMQYPGMGMGMGMGMPPYGGGYGGGGGGGYGGPRMGMGGGGGAPAPNYVPPFPQLSEQELLSRPPPTANIDPADETYPTFSVFVGDMTPDFTEADLYNAFAPAGPIHSVNVVRDKITGGAKGFGFVNFASAAAKTYALEQMKTATTRGIPVRCFESDNKNVLTITGIPPPIADPTAVKAELERIGGMMIGEPSMVRPGVWNATYINYRRAEKALALLNNRPYGPTGGVPTMNASLAVGKQSGTASMPPKGSAAAHGGKPPPTLFIKNISATIDDAALAKYYSKHGNVVKATIVRDHTTNESKGFGFVVFGDEDEALRAMQGTNMTILDSKMLSVELAKIPDGAGRPPPGSAPIAMGRAPMIPRKEPKSRHQNDGDGGFNAPRGFADAATEVKSGLTVFDDDWTTANVPAAAAIAGTNGPPKAGPILQDGKMVGWGVEADRTKIGTRPPIQGTPESTCRAQRIGLAVQPPQPHSQYAYNALQHFAGPTLPIAPPSAPSTRFGAPGGARY